MGLGGYLAIGICDATLLFLWCLLTRGVTINVLFIVMLFAVVFWRVFITAISRRVIVYVSFSVCFCVHKTSVWSVKPGCWGVPVFPVQEVTQGELFIALLIDA